MAKSFNEELIEILKADSRFVDDEGELVKAAVIDRAWKIDRDLVKLLLSKPDIKKKFFDEIEGHWIFNINTFIEYISDKNFLANSYTHFRNKIGLNIDGKFLRERGEVSLVWPYKDCVLEGGQTKEEEKRKEIFFNEILAQDEIDRLFDPKVLTNWKRYTTDGEQKVTEIRRDKNGTIKENLIIKGNNLLALHTLKAQFRGKVKLIYIDPPYNTGSDEFGYNDKFNHSSWLSFMKNRIEIARILLFDQGYIWINCDDNESYYLKVLCDEIFGREYFIGSVSWKKTTGDNTPSFAFTHDTILIYGKATDQLPRVSLTTKQKEQYKNTDNDPRGDWAESDYRSKWTKEERKNLYYGIKQPNTGELIFPDTYTNSLRVWGCEVNTHLQREKEGLVWWGIDGKSKEPKKKRFFKDHKGANTRSVWLDAGTNDEASGEIKELFENKDVFSNPKPEKLLQKIINISTSENDLILDFFVGSGTSAAVALKMNRQFIVIEQLDYIVKVPLLRVKKVVEGEQGGISKSVNWQGGGDFIYCELMKYNQAFMDKIQAAKTSKELVEIWKDIAENSFLNWYVNPEMPEEAVNDFIEIGKAENGLDKQKKLLAELLNKNQLYVNLSEIDDEDFSVSKIDKKLNQLFYGEAYDG